MSESGLVDITGRLRSPAAMPGHWAGCAPPNKGMRFPADPPTVEEIIVVMHEAGAGPYADRTRALIAILWRAGLRISECSHFAPLDPHRLNSVTAIRHCGRSVSEALRIGLSSDVDDVVVLACGEPGRVKGRRTETVRES